MEKALKRSINIKRYLNEAYIEVQKKDFKDTCIYLYQNGEAILRVMFATDERQIDGTFKIYSVFSVPGKDEFSIIYTSLSGDDLSFPSITINIPAAHWYEREIHDMFGLVPEGHPDLRRLVFHDSFPAGSHPLRKDWSAGESDLREWGEGIIVKKRYAFMEVEGEGITEIPVGPVHAGIIEPGHFRFSSVGETIFFLEPRLFYTHKGTEKHFETLGFSEGVRLAERVSGTSSFSHSAAYCMAVERMAGIVLTEKADAVRTLLLEIERLYNHIGDIGNMCAGTGFAVGYAKGAIIKERLMQLNETLTGSRYLRGINTIGGVTKDIFLTKDHILNVLNTVTKEFKSFMKLLLGTVSHMERVENTGKLSRDIAVKLGVTGVAARASGINDDIRKAHPHLLYDRLYFEPHTTSKGDVFARMMVRAEETECSMSMIETLFESTYSGALITEKKDIPPLSYALGYTETPRGSVFYWVKSDEEGRPLRVKFRSPSYCNWPAVPFAVHGNIVPDFPLCNKSFNLSYSGCDM
ncbi:MAG: NADH-quinone oxidoreductase subunit C [Thermodesulfovibrionales bacterium]|jgi:Ni,Fe-hydrogenase III large subunit/Ni,Fe-hydrogenase III component G